MPAPAHAAWWTERPALLRFIADLIAGELATLRHEPLFRAEGWPESLSLDDDLAIDSLELLQVAGALSRALQMDRSGLEDYLLARRTLGDWVEIAGAALGQHDAGMTFSTSGSTGQPKRCSHTTARLEQEAAALAVLFPGRRRLLVAVPSHHIYGFLLTQLLPRHLGVKQEQVLSVRSRLPQALSRHVAPGDLVVGHPQFWQAVVSAHGAEAGFPADVIGVSSTAPCPDEVAAAAEHRGLTALVQLYGSSETAGLGWRNSHRSDYRLLPYLERDVENERYLRRTLPDGSIERVEPQDALAWSGARSFTVGARHDGAVQIGGVNVFPARVRETLLEHPEVRDAAVRLMRLDEGVRLKAFIVPVDSRADRAALLGRLRAWIDARFTAPERPKALTLGEQLPRSAMGKPADWNIQ